MSEFVLCHILARERHLYEWGIAQKEHRWKTSDPNYVYRTLDKLSIGILGCSGSIGMHVARHCHFFGMSIKGLASHRRSQPQPAQHHSAAHQPHASSPSQPPIEWYYTEPASSEGGPSTIPAAFFHGLDYLVNVLPSTASTRDLLTDDVLRHCRRSALGSPRTVFINMGRGDVISEPALLRALLGSHYDGLLASPQHGQLPVPGVDAYLAGAILDVFITEPLPSEHVFYSLSPPLLTVSPHVSGVSAAAKQQIVDLFIDNLYRFINQQPLLYEVNKEKGY